MENSPPDTPLVLFVCTGNTCRSPMAEILLRHLLPPASPWRTASAGTHASGGMPMSRNTCDVMAEINVPHDPGKRSIPLTTELLNSAGLIIPLEPHHRYAVLKLAPGLRDRVRILTTFAPQPSHAGIPDPAGSSIDVYRQCRDHIAACLPGLVEFLQSADA